MGKSNLGMQIGPAGAPVRPLHPSLFFPLITTSLSLLKTFEWNNNKTETEEIKKGEWFSSNSVNLSLPVWEHTKVPQT